MRKFACATLVAVTAALPLSIATAPASLAEGSGVIEMPLTGNWRACDHTLSTFVTSRQNGRAIAHLSTPGSSTVAADVSIVTAEPNTQYNVRLIQMPRASNNCAAPDPGVIAGSFQTNDVGAGGVKIQGSRMSGATGAWVFVDRPSANSQTPAEFYTADFVAAI